MKNIVITLLLVASAATCHAQKDPIRIKTMATTIMIDNGDAKLDGTDPVHKPTWLQMWPGDRKDKDEATQGAIVVGSNRVSEGEMRYRAKIDTTHQKQGYDLLSIGSWTARLKPNILKVVRDSIIQYEGKRMDLVELEVPSRIKPAEGDSTARATMYAEAKGSRINDIPGRQILMDITFIDTLQRTGTFMVMRERNGTAFQKLGVTHEVLNRTHEEFDLWGETVNGRVLNFDCVGGYADLWLTAEERSPFRQYGDRYSSVYYTFVDGDRESGAAGDTITEEFKCFYVTIKTPAKPQTIPLSDVTLSLDTLSEDVIVMIKEDVIQSKELKALPMYVFGVSKQGEHGQGYPLLFLENENVYQGRFPKGDIFLLEGGEFFYMSPTDTYKLKDVSVRNSKYADPPILGEAKE